METKYYSNYKCYDAKGNRFSIFGREKNGKLEIWMWKCNKKDEFKKYLAKFHYRVYLGIVSNITKTEIHPEVLLVPIRENDTAQFTFKKFCEDNFYKKTTQLRKFETDCLVSKNDTILIGKPRTFNKISRM